MSLHFGARHPFCLHLTAHGSCLHGEDDDRLAGKCNVHQPSSTFQTQQLWIIPARSSQNIEMYWDIFILLLHVNADSTFIASPFNLFSWSWWLCLSPRKKKWIAMGSMGNVSHISHKVSILESGAWIRWVCLPACLQCGRVWETTSSSLSKFQERRHVQKLHPTSHIVSSFRWRITGRRAWIFYVLSWPWNASPVVDQLHSQNWCDGFWRRALEVTQCHSAAQCRSDRHIDDEHYERTVLTTDMCKPLY